MRKPISVNIHDSHLGIWQDDARDETLRSEVYAELIRRMRSRGWSIRRNPEVHHRHRCISHNYRLGARGTLRCEIELAGRTVKVEFWSTTAKQENRNGRRYDFNKLKRMAKLDRLRVELEFRRITAWLKTLAPVKVERRDEQDLPAMQRIEKRYAESWHKDKELGRPVCSYDSNRRAKDGALLEQGQTVWFADRKGRIVRGTAYYNINNMWWVIAGGKLFNEACFYLLTAAPVDLRTKHNERARRNRLEAELQIAVKRMDYQRAHVLKTIIFGAEQTYMIWARDNQAYYRSQYAGYSSDTAGAGRYTRAEAEAECRRVPHELEMVCPDGTHVSFDRSAA
ncbi:hypothetical protein GOE00_02200 [Sinorhizobium medicae]|uniref:hypothetical protein n=1 Tax=Sinorhizobium medicae TaxID=110321 RepID=UPI000FDB4143|nr:hypothetical protein [Sinorhizobium medicae]MDX0530782.1 hypothetical protein [Sinorhizobium medicae]MDX0865564.1 hypothetical protein [Sinorhizobium medicae]MDX0919871.1 hypothetical protein [Sinorhizobium medicae]MDX0943448.1 hypothetical protein [Sinorhizobium medicae]MQV48323.1 hypothetical protein [Sinorhizobium medicae]